VEYIDGPLGVLGFAGVWVWRNDNGLPIVGYMQFEPEDVEFLKEFGAFTDVITHEMVSLPTFFEGAVVKRPLSYIFEK